MIPPPLEMSKGMMPAPLRMSFKDDFAHMMMIFPFGMCMAPSF